MKKIFLLLNIFALCVLASCDKNEFAKFNDKDAFVAFGKASYAIAEDGAKLTIPVTLASVAGVETSVTVSGVDGTAVSGVDYTIMNGGVLNFNASTRTANVEIQIINRSGEYTGDLNFSLQFSNLGSVSAGAQATTAVTIQDLDHPLSPILGTYTATTQSGRGDFSWTVTLDKDASDVTKIWILDLDPYFASYGYTAANGYNTFYGVVNSELTQIAMPCGQKVGYDNVAVVLCDENYDAVYSGNITLNIDVEKKTITIDGMWGIDDAGWWNPLKQVFASLNSITQNII